MLRNEDHVREWMEKIWTKPFDDTSKQKATDKAELLSQLRLEKI